MAVKIELNDDTQDKGTEFYVQDLGTLVNGKEVSFSDEEVERFENVHGKKMRDAFKGNPNIKVSSAKEGGS